MEGAGIGRQERPPAGAQKAPAEGRRPPDLDAHRARHRRDPSISVEVLRRGGTIQTLDVEVLIVRLVRRDPPGDVAGAAAADSPASGGGASPKIECPRPRGPPLPP